MPDRVVQVAANSPAIEAVRALWRRNSATLGFFPDGAFRHYAASGSLLVAEDDRSRVLGYLLFRHSRSSAVIIHLCVSDDARGRGVARLLFETLKERASECTAIRLTCRADFPANTLWPRLGFEPRGERPARMPGHTLKTWLFDLGHPDLFSQVHEELPISVIDANVFFDLQDPETPKTLESKALTEDWIQDTTRVRITPEIFAEIDRNPDHAERRRRRTFADSMLLIPRDRDREEALAPAVSEVIKARNTDSDKSDVRQLSQAIAGGATYFITRDSGLLSAADEIAARWPIIVVRPSQFISLTDEELHEAAYQPARLSGSPLSKIRCGANDLELISKTFLATDVGERRSALEQVVTRLLGNPQSGRLFKICDRAGQAVAVLGLENVAGGVMRVPLLRVLPSPLAYTLTRHIVWAAVQEATRTAPLETVVAQVLVTDPAVNQTTRSALETVAFQPTDAGWLKANVMGMHNAQTLLSTLHNSVPVVAARQAIGAALAQERPTPREQLEIEKIFWPLKVRQGLLPVFIVPVQPQWALHLFHEGLAAEDLFGAREHVMLNTENVYYRASRPPYPTSPSRVIWYVSGGKGYSDAQKVVGTSLVTSSQRGPAKELFRRYARLGIFSWPDVRRTARGRATAEVLAFTFTHTELFRHPIPWPVLRSMLQKHMKRSAPVQGPIRLRTELAELILLQASASTA